MLLALFLASAVHAAPKPAEICALPGTIDQKLRFAQAVLPGQKTAYTTVVTKLLAQAYAPLLDDLSARAQQLTREQVERALPKIDQFFERDQFVREPNRSNLTQEFERAYRLKNFRGRSIGVTDYNLVAMKRLIRAVLLVDVLSSKVERPQGCMNLLIEHSYTTQEVENGVRAGNLSVIQAASQLSAVPVENLSAESLIREILSCPQGCDASPMVRYSIALKPRVLGSFGSNFYPSTALVRNQGKLEFSDELKASLKQDAEQFALRGHRNFELGHGCPVSFSTDGLKRSSLQRYMDAIVHVYDLIP